MLNNSGAAIGLQQQQQQQQKHQPQQQQQCKQFRRTPTTKRSSSSAASRPPRLLLLLLAALRRPRGAQGCGRQPARVQEPPAEFFRSQLQLRQVPCGAGAAAAAAASLLGDDPHGIYCANGGSCLVLAKWSLPDNRPLELLDRPYCLCQPGYRGVNCELIDFLPSSIDVGPAAAASVVTLLALLSMVLATLLLYFCCCRDLGNEAAFSPLRPEDEERRRREEATKEQRQNTLSPGGYLCSGLCLNWSGGGGRDSGGEGGGSRGAAGLHAPGSLALIGTPAKSAMRRRSWGDGAFDRDSVDLYIDEEFVFGVGGGVGGDAGDGVTPVTVDTVLLPGD